MVQVFLVCEFAFFSGLNGALCMTAIIRWIKSTSWHHQPLDDRELLSKWIVKIQRTNTTVNEHLRLCNEQFKSSCFIKRRGSTRRDTVYKERITTHYVLFCNGKGRKLPTEQSKAPSSYLMVCGNYSMKCCPLPLFELSSVPFVSCYS